MKLDILIPSMVILLQREGPSYVLIRVLAEQEGTWNKVGMLRKLLEETPPRRAEWILFMQVPSCPTSLPCFFQDFITPAPVSLSSCVALLPGQGSQWYIRIATSDVPVKALQLELV